MELSNKLGNTHVHSKDIRTVVSNFIRAFPSVSHIVDFYRVQSNSN